MVETIARVLHEVEAFAFTGPESVEEFRRRFTGRKGQVAELFEALKSLDGAAKAAVGKPLNEVKQRALERLAEAEAQLAAQAHPADQPLDPTLPGDPQPIGSMHPLRQVRRRVLDIFARMGFEVALGPEIEDDWHNFTGLNFAADHPARDMQDTFFVGAPGEESNWLLRTHTTTVQLRELERRPPPVRIVMPGRVYRNEAISARAHCYFHQIDGFAVDEGLSFADLKQTLLHFVKQLFGESIEIRLRASYFPFTEISVEMDISCRICHGSGCTVCKHSGWVEILGAGMVDPNVLAQAAERARQLCVAEWDPSRYTGFAWGMGLERVAQLVYRVPDLRLYSQNDLRFLRQFQRGVSN